MVHIPSPETGRVDFDEYGGDSIRGTQLRKRNTRSVRNVQDSSYKRWVLGSRCWRSRDLLIWEWRLHGDSDRESYHVQC
jgi:hypothetical protein